MEELFKTLETTWDAVRAIEPARGKVEAQQVLETRTALENLVAARTRRDRPPLPPDDAAKVDDMMATIYARAGAVAIAAGDESNAERWLAEAERLARDDDQRAEIAAARRSQERYRALVHGRNRIAHGHDSDARKIWKTLLQGEPDAISRAAELEIKAPRPLGPDDRLPSLGRYNGIGTGFYGRRDEWSDGSYATTQCVSILWIPVLPLSAWRVRDSNEGGEAGYVIFAREQLSGFARFMRWAMPAAVALVIAVAALSSYLGSPERLARQRWDAALELAQGGNAEVALRELDGALERDLLLVDDGRAERAGVEVVRLTAGLVATPFTTERLDQAIRVVHRYRGLPSRAQAGAAQSAMLERLEAWTRALGDGVETAEPRLALLRAASEIAAMGDRRQRIDAQIAVTRLALANAKEADHPLDALAILVEPGGGAPDAASTERADAIVKRLCESPSLLLDAGGDLDSWMAATQASDLRQKVIQLRDAATKDRASAEAEDVTPKQLAEMQARRPADQYVALQIARNEASAGNLDGAAARLTRLGPPGMRVRGARLLLAQITAGQGKLEEADAQLTALLGARLSRFTAASAALQEVARRAQERIEGMLRSGDVPFDLRSRVEAAGESERQNVLRTWFDEQMKSDSALSAARERYVALADVVAVVIAAGTIKLRRAQAMSGAAREAMLQEAERAFLAIRTEAEGQPEFRLALGEIYARLGKTKESDAELGALLANKDALQSLQVAEVYRAIGSAGRAKEIAKDVYGTASSPAKERAATLLGLMTDDEEAEGWYRKADQSSVFVKAVLIEFEAKRLERAGKTAECAAKYAQAAKLQLSTAGATRIDGYNNAALAYLRGFDCSSDPQALRDASAALETAYRREPEMPLLVGNLSHQLLGQGRLRVISRHVDARALRLSLGDAGELLDAVLDGPERAAVLAELAADPSMRRRREMLAQYEVLAPNSPNAYASPFADAMRRRDAADAAAVVERARRAKGLDTSEVASARQRNESGANDAEHIAQAENRRARLEGLLARPGTARLDPRTRAAGWYLLSSSLATLGLFKTDPAALRAARDAAATAMKLWPALDGHDAITAVLIDEAGLEGDAKTWLAARRSGSTTAVLDQLVTDRHPLGAKILASKQWADVSAHAVIVGIPTLHHLRLARLLGNTALEARAREVFDDKLLRLGLELALLFDPDTPSAKQDLAYLDRR